MTLEASPPEPSRRSRRQHVAANSDAPLAGAPPARKGLAARLLDRLTNDRLLVHVFRVMLLVAFVTLGLDLRQMWLDEERRVALEPGESVPPALRQPVRAPSPSSPPPNEITTDPGTLSSAMTMTLGPGGVLTLTGTIDPGAGERLAAELAQRGEYVTRVDLDSPGGSVSDALAMSSLLREGGRTVRVGAGALCASSCPIVLSGGTVREVSARASVGVHQIFAADEDALDPRFDGMAQAQATTARIGRHLAEMDVDGAVWLHAMETPKDALYYLSPDELTRFRLATVLLDPEAAPPVPATRPDADPATATD